MSDTPKFSFGGASPFGGAQSSGTSTPSLFGTSGATGGFGGFGNSATKNTTGSTPSTFGGFGASTAQTTSGIAATGTPSFAWGNPPVSTNAPSSTTTATPSIFGSTTPAAPKIGGFSFGSTTPAGEPPASTTLDASTGATSQPAGPGGSLFGGGKNLFGQQSTTPAAGQAAPIAKSLFGGQTQSTGQSGNLFGGPGQDKGQGSALFPGLSQAKNDATPAATTTTAPSFSFTSTQTTTSAPNASNLFAPSTSATPAAAQNSQKPLFSFPPNGGTPGPAIGKSAESSTQKPPMFSFPPVSSSPDSTAKPAASPLSGFNLGGATQSTPSSGAAATTTAPAFSFPSTSTATTQPSSSASAAPSFPSFAPPAASASATQPATSAPLFPSFTVGGASTSAAQPASTSTATPANAATSQPTVPSGLTASTTGPTPPSQSRLKNKTMDEILTRWATDLTKYTKDFRSTAETVATWDQHLVDNMSKISKLYSATLTAERQTESVELQLSAVENQQAELESWLNVYEKQVDELLERENKGGQGEVGGPDSERERTYRLSEKLGERLEEMGTDLEGMVGEINAANSALSRNGKQDEPITQIVRILNSHLTQLKTIDDGAAALNAKVEKAQKLIGSLAYSNGGMSANGTTAVDDFYKSYLGRRG